MSTLNVDQIGHSTSGTTAITIASDGKVTMPENDSGWIIPTLNSPYTHYSSPYGDVRYRKIGDIVHIQGLLNVNSAIGGNVIFALPSGYAPPLQIITSQKNGNTGEARVDVETNGNVTMVNAASNTTWLSVFMTFMVA